jgi:hypothetical protein
MPSKKLGKTFNLWFVYFFVRTVVDVSALLSSGLPVQLSDPGEVVFPFGFKVESRGLEGICLLLDCITNHLPEALGDGKAQVSGRDLSRIHNSAPKNTELTKKVK